MESDRWFEKTGCIIKLQFKDGDNINEKTIVAEIKGPVRSILKAERLALNFISKMSGIATETKILNDKYRIDAQNTLPVPESFSDNNMRWFSASKGKPHTSIVAAFLDREDIGLMEHESYRDGVFLALFASLILATGLDALWTFVGLFTTQ